MELQGEPSTPPRSLSPRRPSRQSTPMRPLSTADRQEREQSRVLYVTYLNIALYALCYLLQRPVEPFLVQQLAKGGGDDDVPRTYGRLQAFFAVVQTVGSPLVGILLDRVGVRRASAIVFLASAASYVLLAGATTLHVLFWSKVPTALQHAFLVAQATAAVATAGAHPDLRAAALGRMTTAYTVGATIGPIVGGNLADRGDLYAGAKLAVMGSLVSALLSLAFLPNQAERRQHGISKSQTSFVEEVTRARQLALRPTLGPLLAVKVLGGVTASIHQTALPLVLAQRLRYDPADLGLVMSASMFAVAAFGALGTAPLVRRYGAQDVVRLGLVSRSFLVLVLSLVVSVARNQSLLASQIPVSLASVMVSVASHALATSLTTLTTGSVERDEQGALLGLEHGLFSLARIAGPPLGTFLLATSGFSGVSVVCGLVDVGMVALFSVVALGMTGSTTTKAATTKTTTSMGATTPARKAKD